MSDHDEGGEAMSGETTDQEELQVSEDGDYGWYPSGQPTTCDECGNLTDTVFHHSFGEGLDAAIVCRTCLATYGRLVHCADCGSTKKVSARRSDGRLLCTDCISDDRDETLNDVIKLPVRGLTAGEIRSRITPAPIRHPVYLELGGEGERWASWQNVEGQHYGTVSELDTMLEGLFPEQRPEFDLQGEVMRVREVRLDAEGVTLVLARRMSER